MPSIDEIQYPLHKKTGREKTPRSRPLNVGSFLCCLTLASLCVSLPAGSAGIYVFTSEEGSVSLSNVPVDLRYKLLTSDDSGSPVVPLPNERRKKPPDLAGKASFNEIVKQTALTYGLESALLHAVISVESGYNPSAVSPKGARGLMQLMPNTASRYGVADTLDPAQNLRGGAKYLRDLLKLFNSDVELVVAAYNAGENAVARHGNRIPPYRETVSYVPRVMAYYQQYQAGGDSPKAD